MIFFGKKDLVYLLTVSILLLSCVFFFFKGKISEEKYEHYRQTVLNGSLECSIQLLGEYIETGDPHLSPFLASRLGELPLGSEEREAVTLFCRDVAESEKSPDGKRRSMTYAIELFSVLSENRLAIKRGDMTKFPLYEGEAPVFSQPSEKPYYREAKRLLGEGELRSYMRGDTVGYRTASSYAEYDGGILVRYLCRRDGKATVSPDSAKKDALSFASLYCGGGEPLSESRENGLFIFNFEDFYIVVSPFGGVMRFERTKF